MSRNFIAQNQRRRAEAVEFIMNLPADMPLQITVEQFKQTRSSKQNARLHAMIGDISKQLKWDGEQLGIDSWKRLLTAGWMRATKRSLRMVRAIDGSGVEPLYQRTSRLNVSEMAELIEFVTAWAVDQGVHFYDDLNEEQNS